jgi:hypothetical protein
MIDESLVRSGFDVETLLGERYLTYVLLTALEAGVLPLDVLVDDPRLHVAIFARTGTDRLYDEGPGPSGELPSQNPQAFDVEILDDGHPSGGDVRVRLVGTVDRRDGGAAFFVVLDLFLQLTLVETRDDDGALAGVGLAVHVVDIASDALSVVENDPDHPVSKAEILARLQQIVDRTLDIGGASTFKRVQSVALHRHPRDGDTPPALGLYVNIRLRTGPQETDMLDDRGDVTAARCFLPSGDDVAMASRPGLYDALALDAFSRTAFKNVSGDFEHVLRPNLFNPKSKRLGTVDSISVGQIVDPGPNGTMVPRNGLRIVVKGEYEVDTDVDPDLRITIDVIPRIDGDGLLAWDTNLDVSVDALFEFLTLFGFLWLSVLFGSFWAGGVFLGLIVAGEIGADVYLEEHYEDLVQNRVDATLTDVIPDRLKLARRRWDPFFTTLHEVVTRPTQAQFGPGSFTLSGAAVVGRETRIVDDVVVRDELRDADGAITGLRYRVRDFADIQDDLAATAPGTLRGAFSRQSADVDPDLYDLALDEIAARLADADDPHLLGRIPYFPARVFVVGHEIVQILCLSDREVSEVVAALRDAFEERTRAQIVADDGDEIRAQVIQNLSAGGATPTEDEIQKEVDARIDAKVAAIMDDHDDPVALELADQLRPLLRFDVTPVELADLAQRGILTIDGVDVIKERTAPHAHRLYLRDHPDGDDKDNLLERPRYTPTPAGPSF